MFPCWTTSGIIDQHLSVVTFCVNAHRVRYSPLFIATPRNSSKIFKIGLYIRTWYKDRIYHSQSRNYVAFVGTVLFHVRVTQHSFPLLGNDTPISQECWTMGPVFVKMTSMHSPSLDVAVFRRTCVRCASSIRRLGFRYRTFVIF
jgi:hypothetical protein